MVYYVNVYSYGMDFKVYNHHKNDWQSKCYADSEYIEYRIIVKMKD